MPKDTAETAELLEIDPQDAATGGDPERPAEVEQKPAKADADETLKEMRRALKETRQALKETNETARFWMEQARGGKKEEAAAEPEEPTVSVDLVEAVTNNDHKAVAKALREMGFVSKSEVNATVNGKAAQIARDNELYKQYPDLKDSKSEFFQVTREIYNELAAKDPALKNSGTLAEIAAELADKRLNGGDADARPARSRSRIDEDLDGFDDEETDEEEERVQRVRRQTGGRDRRSSRAASPDSDELDPTQKSIVAKLRAAGADISEDAYRKRAQKGVRMAGLPTRRPRY